MRFMGKCLSHHLPVARSTVFMLLVSGIALPSRHAAAQTTDDYRNKAGGIWSDTSTWERFDGAGWVDATEYPENDNAEEITIRSETTVTIDVAVGKNIKLDQLVVEFEATLVIEEKTLIQDGPGTDLISYGTIQLVSDHFRFNGASTGVFKSTSIMDIDDKKFNFQDTSTGTFENGAQISIAALGELKAEGNSVLSIEQGTQIDSNGRISFKTDATVSMAGSVNNNGVFVVNNDAVLTVENTARITNNDVFRIKRQAHADILGTFINADLVDLRDSSTIDFLNGSVYEHAQNGGNLPDVGRTTWQTGSTSLVTGITGAVPGELDTAFHHFTWDAAGQTAALDLDAGLTSIGGDLTISSTGTSTLSWVQDANSPLTVGGDYVQTGGTFIYADGSGSGTMSVSGYANITGGTLRLSTGTGTPTLSLAGDLTVSGGAIDVTGSGTGTIRFEGSTTQSITAPSGISGNIRIEINNSAGIQLQDDLSAPGDLTSVTGSIDLNGNDLSVGGDLTVNTSFLNPNTLTFDGTGTQTFTYAPGSLTLPELLVDKTTGSLVLDTDLSVSSTLVVRSGVLNDNGHVLTLLDGATLFSAAPYSGSINFDRYYGLDADGWRMIASPLDGVNYSSLNAPFHTQGGAWAELSGGVSNLQSLDFGAQDWAEITGSDAQFSGGEGYIFYMYENDRNGDPVLPATWTVSGTLRSSSSRSLSWNTDPSDSYNYVGNPTAGNLDWDAVVSSSTNLGSTYATWDPALTVGGGMTGYKYYNSASGVGDAGRYIPPFTAFMAQPTSSGGSISFPTSEAANRETANYYGKGRGMSRHIRLEIEGEGQAERETYVIMDADASDSTFYSDPFDVDRLRPLSPEFVTMWFVTPDRQLAFEGRPFSGGQERYEIAVTASSAGIYELSWPTWHLIPDHWIATLFDHTTGRSVDLREVSVYRFTIQESETSSSNDESIYEGDIKPRFELHLTDPDTAENSAPPEISASGPMLDQNYPNPFNPETTIRYLVPEASPVRLEIFDILGRRVANLLDRTQSSGWHEVRWNAGYTLSSGLYIYRLVVAGQSVTKVMILQN